MTTQFARLKTLLAEIFQLDQSDLDFGIYCIMNLKRNEIIRFLDKDLLPQIQEAFEEYAPASTTRKEQELAEAITQTGDLEIDPECLSKVKSLREQLAQAVDVVALEADVYNRLYRFFRRFYKDGDFFSLRRYKEGAYAIRADGAVLKFER